MNVTSYAAPTASHVILYQLSTPNSLHPSVNVLPSQIPNVAVSATSNSGLSTAWKSTPSATSSSATFVTSDAAASATADSEPSAPAPNAVPSSEKTHFVQILKENRRLRCLATSFAQHLVWLSGIIQRSPPPAADPADLAFRHLLMASPYWPADLKNTHDMPLNQLIQCLAPRYATWTIQPPVD